VKNNYFAVMTISSVCGYGKRSLAYTAEVEMSAIDRNEVYMIVKGEALTAMKNHYRGAIIDSVCVDFFDCWPVERKLSGRV
jgi:nitrogen regulatory protein PII